MLTITTRFGDKYTTKFDIGDEVWFKMSIHFRCQTAEEWSRVKIIGIELRYFEDKSTAGHDISLSCLQVYYETISQETQKHISYPEHRLFTNDEMICERTD